jgi:hypothetical protein
MIDLHISQIRPENIQDEIYVPAGMNHLEITRGQYGHLNNIFFDFYHRWREPTRTWFS